MTSEGEPPRTEERRPSSWFAPRPETRHVVPSSHRVGPVSDICFAVVSVVTGAYFMYVGRDSWFFADEWAMAEQVRFPSGLVKPYNGHLSVLILGLYRGLLEVFGFSVYWPYRLAGVLSFLAVSAAMYVVMRREVGAVAAAVSGVLLLWPAGISVEPGGLNHSLTAVGAIVCAYGLNGSGRRRDLLVGGGLSFALLSAGGGVAVIAASVGHCVFTRPHWRRWLAVAVPSILWAVWYQLAIPDNPVADAARPGLPDLLSFTVRHSLHSFSSLTLGNRYGGVVVGAVLLAVLVSRLTRGLAEAAGTLAWIGALFVWWFGISWSRWFAEGVTFRYEFVSAVIILLALLPSGASPATTDPRSNRFPWPDRIRDLAKARAAAPAMMLLTLLIVVGPSSADLRSWGSEMALFGQAQQRQAESMAFERQVPEPAGSFGFANRPASRIRRLFEVFGGPHGYGDPAAYVDAAVTVTKGMRSSCRSGSRSLDVVADGAVLAVARDEPITVTVKRFDFAPQVAAEVPARSQKRLEMETFGSDARWSVTVSGGCLLER